MTKQTQSLVFIPRPLSASTQRLKEDLKYAGYEVVQQPLITLSPLTTTAVPDVHRAADYDAMVCVSGLAADIWVDNLGKLNDYERAHALQQFPHIYVPGKTTAETISGYGGKAIMPDAGGTGTPAIFAKMLADNRGELKGKKIRIICGEGGAAELTKLLEEAGAYASALSLYEVLIPELSQSEWERQMHDSTAIDYCWITSGSILKALIKHFAQPWFKEYFQSTTFIAGSPRIHNMAKAEGLTNLVGLPNPENKTLLRHLKSLKHPEVPAR